MTNWQLRQTYAYSVNFGEAVETVGKVIDGAGVVVLIAGSLVAAVLFVRDVAQQQRDAYRTFRQSLGRSILLGLELLVAGDIIRTVAATPTFESVGVLVIIVLIRTFLSFTLELELSGRWPWQRTARE